MSLGATVFPRVSGIATYLRGATPFYKWKLESADCPLCGPSFFIALSPNPFMVRCMRCRANVTNLAIAQALKTRIPDAAKMQAYEMSTYGSTFELLKRSCASVVGSEYFPGKIPGELVEGIRNEDAQNLSFEDASFDLVTSNQVFEHVPDNLRAFEECRRVLKPGGSLFFTVPLHDTGETEQVATIEAGEIKWLGRPEFHSSRTTGPNSVPVFWRFSIHDIARRVAAASFRSVEVLPVSICSIQGTPQPVLHAIA